MTHSNRTVAVLGSGVVAAAVAAALLDAGRRVRSWGATPSWQLTAVIGAGASASRSPLAAIRGAGAVVLAPDDPADAAAIEARLGGRLTTTTVLTVREPAGDIDRVTAWLARDGVHQVDCVALGPPTQIGMTSMVLLVSGPSSAVRAYREVLDDLGAAVAVDGASGTARRTEIALTGLWYDVNVAVLRALANVDESARPVVELELRGVLAQLPAIVRSLDAGSPVRGDAGIALHARALAAVLDCRRRGGPLDSELEQAARQVDALLGRDDPDSPLARIADGLRWDRDPSTEGHHRH